MSQASCASHQLSCPPWGHSAGSRHRSVLRRPSHHSILLWSPLHPTWLRRGSWKQLKSMTPSRNCGLAEHKGAVTKCEGIYTCISSLTSLGFLVGSTAQRALQIDSQEPLHDGYRGFLPPRVARHESKHFKI